MGWGRMLLMGNLGQQLDIEDQRAEINSLRAEIRRGRSAAPDTDGLVRQLQAENDELRLYVAAIVRLLLSKGIVSKSEIEQVVAAVDAEDGTRDGKFTGNL